MKDDPKKSITILMADDDQDDCLLVSKAFEASRLANDLRFVADGEELMDYLYHRGKYADAQAAPAPRAHPSRSEHAPKGRAGGPQRDQGRRRTQGDPRGGADDVEG